MNEEERDVDDDEEDEEEEEDPFSQIIYEQKYYEDREDDFLNGKVFWRLQKCHQMVLELYLYTNRMMMLMMTEMPSEGIGVVFLHQLEFYLYIS